MDQARVDLDDILIGIFANFPKGVRCFTWDNPKAHTFFHNQRSKFPILQEYAFPSNGYFPYSRELEWAYDTLTACGLLFSWGLNFNPHEFRPSVNTSYQRRSQQYSDDVKKQIEDLSALFQIEFNAQPR